MRLSLALIFCFVAATGFLTKPKSPKLIWSDEFDYTGLPDSTKWTYDIGTGPPEDWGNQELEYYTRKASNARVENGKLIIEAHQESFGGKNFTSARLVTRGKADWKNVRIDVRAKVASGKGAWSAIWMMPVVKQYGEWPACGEIDIMEHVGFNPKQVHGTIHTQLYNHMIGTQKEGIVQVPDATEQFHVYSLDWKSDRLDFLVDGKIYQTVTKVAQDDFRGWPFDQQFYLIMNLAVGGGWGGRQGVDASIWPRKMEVDYVRVYR